MDATEEAEAESRSEWSDGVGRVLSRGCFHPRCDLEVNKNSEQKTLVDAAALGYDDCRCVLLVGVGRGSL